LADTPRALAAFNAITPALRRHIVGWVEAAKQMKTREKRVQLTVTRMVEQSRKKRKR
jgi:uncharacterized protein YdeI (YjbR/CyaY-like superfamily)